ncbi:MAG: hypothetical protein WBG89_11805 [Ornithinimicrobium sp.]
MEFLDSAWGIVAALLPTAGLLYLFWVIMTHILEGDRRERAAQRLWEAEQDAAAASKGAGEDDSSERNAE